MKIKLSFILVFLYYFACSQLSSFSVSLTKNNDETCPSNGSLNWSTNGTTAGSTIVYNIVNTSTNSVVLSTSSNAFSGLTAGTYKIVATQTLDTNSNQATSNIITINNNIIPLSFNLSKNSDEICGSDGSFTVNVSSGRSPYTYQILDGNNNVTYSQTTSNVFSGLSSGTYKVRVVDQCGAGTVSLININNTPSSISNFYISGIYGSSCSEVKIFIGSYAWNVKFPITMSVKYTNPITGLSETQTSGLTNSNSPTVTIPNFPNLSSLNMDVTVTDACGTTKTSPKNFFFRPSVSVGYGSAYCGGEYATFIAGGSNADIGYPLFSVEFTTFPVGFNPTVYNSNHGLLKSAHQYGSSSQPLPNGTYNYIITDQCGRQKTGTFNMNQGITPYTMLSSKNECESGTKILYGILQPFGYEYSQFRITNGPAAFVTTYGGFPYNIPAGNFDGPKRAFSLPSMPYGNYTYEFTTNCGTTIYTGSFNLQPDSLASQNATVETNCTGQFKLSISNYTDYFIVQKYYPALGKWGKAPNYYSDGLGVNYNNTGWVYSYTDFNSWLNSPDGPGMYRIVPNSSGVRSQYSVYENNASVLKYCDAKVLATFETGGSVDLVNAYAYLCSNSTYNVAISATGSTPLSYSLVSDATSSATTLVNNGSNPIFNGLNGGVYYFRVTNPCGNFITRKLEVATLGKPGIKFIPNCADNTLKLAVEGLNYLNYQWYKASDPTIILSTTSILDLGVFNASKAGLYKVRTYTTSPTYCIDKVEEFNITASPFTAGLSGTGQNMTINYNGIDQQLNLFNYLTGLYDGFGIWSEISGPSTNLLQNQYWNIAVAGSGTYVFRYTVTSPCSGLVTHTEVTINLIKVCYKLPVKNNGINIKTAHGITAMGRAGADNGNWPMVRQSAWTVLEAKTKGFVVNRVANPNVDIEQPSEGMMVFDTIEQCLKIYNGIEWKCYTTPSCP